MKTIKEMPEHSRPREKLREKGASALTDEELVATILGMGTAERPLQFSGSRFDSMNAKQKTSLINPTGFLLWIS